MTLQPKSHHCIFIAGANLLKWVLLKPVVLLIIKTDGADYWLKYYGKLPEYYISPEQLGALGWKKNERPSQYVSERMLGGGVYDNKDRKLPDKIGRIWYEGDINYTPGRRNLHRILWSNDGLIFVTYDHYYTFYEVV